MKKKKLFISIMIALLLLMSKYQALYAIADPRSVENNHFGIHIIDEHDLDRAAELVNSSGGQWGYVTIVIREDDRNKEKWQNTFNKMRERKLIPLVRLATKLENGKWAKPREEDLDSWTDFLSSLNWVVKNRYVILFNEPNHADEWGGEVNPEEYAKMLLLFEEKLKTKSENFFILPAGFDASVPNSSTSLTMDRYLQRMFESEPTVFTKLDGWTSHAYPNPSFSASPLESGKTSIISYKSELRLAESFGLNTNSPVFITETGWIHNGDDTEIPGLSPDSIARYFKIAFESVWTDEDIIAITPFVLRYLEPPFDQFSWIDPISDEPYAHYNEVQHLSKPSGEPIQIFDNKITTKLFPTSLVIHSTYHLDLSFTNTGQSIWDENNVTVNLKSTLSDQEIEIGKLNQTKPFEEAVIPLTIRTPEVISQQSIKVTLEHEGQPFGEGLEKTFMLIPPPSLLVQAKLWIKPQASANDFTLLIYDEGDLLSKYESLPMQNGEGKISQLFNIIPHRNYRFVLTKPNYLPRQTYEYLQSDHTAVEFKRLLPVDFDKDGAFTDNDIVSALRDPINALAQLSPF